MCNTLHDGAIRQCVKLHNPVEEGVRYGNLGIELQKIYDSIEHESKPPEAAGSSDAPANADATAVAVVEAAGSSHDGVGDEEDDTGFEEDESGCKGKVAELRGEVGAAEGVFPPHASDREGVARHACHVRSEGR